MRSSNNTFLSNKAIGNVEGIVCPTSGNIMRNNQMYANRYNLHASGHNSIDTTNLVDGKPVYYFVGVFDEIIDSSSDAGFVYCIDCKNISVKGLTLKNNYYGIFLENTSNSTIENLSSP